MDIESLEHKVSEKAGRGMKNWLFLRDKYNIGVFDGVIFFPSFRNDLNEEAIKLIPYYMDKKFISRALALYVQDYLDEMLRKSAISEDKILLLEKIDSEEMSELLQYYRLQQFTKNICVISFKMPFGNDGVIGKEGISIGDYVKSAIYI